MRTAWEPGLRDAQSG